MIGYRTNIIAALLFIAPALARWGFNIDPAIIADALIVIAPAVMHIMRSITRTPMGRKQPKRTLR